MRAARGSAGPGLRAGLLRFAFAAALLSVAGCATPPEDPIARAAYDDAADPLEPFNRFMFDVNLAFDDALFKPAATLYRDTVPEPLRDAFRNLIRNLRAPVIFANDLLQGELRRASVTMQRFLLNSAFGFAGLVDVADMAVGLKYHEEDFGQTLGVWGFGEGFYLFLPVLGPSSARDMTGVVVDGLIDPVSYAFGYFDIGYGPPLRSVLTALDARSRAIESLEDIQKTSIDFYASLRSLYRQKRESDIANGRGTPNAPGAPTLESPVISESGGQGLPTPGLAPVMAVTSVPTPPAPAPIFAPMPEGAGAAPQYIDRRRVDWSAWAPALTFNAPSIAPQPADARGLQLASHQPAAAPMPAPPAALPPPSVAAMRAMPAPSVAPAATILFRDGSAALSANDRALLRQLAAAAGQRGSELRVVGHAGDRAPGADELAKRLHNFDMSWSRATVAAEELERAGVPPQRIVIEAKGETEPTQSPGAGDAAGNRRVNIYLQ